MSQSRVRLDRRFDWVGPPDPISKIRPIRLRRVDGETEEEAEYRRRREELNEWNSRFWADHNTRFEGEKAAFVENKKKELSRLESVSAADMSAFYQQFLNSRRDALLAYNKEWYRRNMQLIYPALRVNLLRFMRLLKR